MIISHWILLTLRNISDKSCRENRNYILNSVTFPWKWRSLWDNVEKCGSAGQGTDNNIRRRMRFACWITKATDTYWKFVILISLHGNNGYANAAQWYVTRQLPLYFCSYDSEMRKKNLISWCYDTGLPSVLFSTPTQKFVRVTSIRALCAICLWQKFWQFLRACRSFKKIPAE